MALAPIEVVIVVQRVTTLQALHPIRTLGTPTRVQPLGIVVDGIVNFLNLLLQGILEFIGDMFATGVRELLFFESPYELVGPNQAFAYNLRFALALLPIVVVIGALSMPFANRRKAVTWRQVWRVIEVLIFIALARPALHVALVLVNVTGEYVFPTSYDLSFAGEGLLNSLSALGVTGIALVIGGYVLSGISFLGILFLFFVLFLREFIFHLVYQGFPILIVGWYLDWGPFRIVNHIAVVVFRLAGYLVLVGPLIALALQVGVVFGGGSWPPDGQAPSDPETTVEFWRQFAGWFMGIALASAFGLKAAMLGGVPVSQISAARDRSKSTSANRSRSPDPTGERPDRGSIRGQARDVARLADRRAPYSGTLSDRLATTRASMAESWNQVTDRDDVAGEVARNLGSTGKTLGPIARRTTADAYAGSKYAATHLHESPAGWARAGVERYRNDPLVSNERRAMWLVEREPTRSLTQDQITERTGWSEAKTQRVLGSLEESGHVEVYDIGRGTIVMSHDRPSDPSIDRASQADQYSGHHRRAERNDD